MFIHFDCCLYRNLVKMVRGWLWKYFEVDLVIVIVRIHIFMMVRGVCSYRKVLKLERKMARFIDVEGFFEADLFIFNF